MRRRTTLFNSAPLSQNTIGRTVGGISVPGIISKAAASSGTATDCAYTVSNAAMKILIRARAGAAGTHAVGEGLRLGESQAALLGTRSPPTFSDGQLTRLLA